MLAKLGLSRGLHCHDAVLGGRRRKTNAEVVASTADRPGSRLAASRLALVASELETNQAVVHGTAGAPFFFAVARGYSSEESPCSFPVLSFRVFF